MTDTSTRVESVTDVPVTDSTVVVGEHERYLGQLVFQTPDQAKLLRQYRQFISKQGVLTDTGLYEAFTRQLVEDGYEIFLLPSADQVLEWHSQWADSLKVDGVELFDKKTGEPSSLHPYQQYGLRKALFEYPESFKEVYGSGFFFFNWGTGTGKTVAACSGAQELFNHDRIDLVIVFTLRQVKVDFTRFANTATKLRAVAVDGEKDFRRKEYRRGEADMYVLNYEKARKSVDLDLLIELVKGKRVLFVFDEVQKILNENTNRDGVNKLLDSVKDKFVWPMSASIIDGDPDRYWKVFEWMKSNPLGTLKQFHRDYVERIENRKFIVRTRNGPFPVYETIHHFDFTKLDEVRHRVAPWTHSVRKTDPGVREFFKGLNFVEVPVEMDPADRQVYNLIVEEAEEYKKSTEPVEGVTPATFYQALRYTCLGLESHKYSDNALSKVISAKPVSNKTCAKLERLLDDVATIIDEGDKVVIFTHWTNLSLFRISEALEKKKIAHVVHHGGQSLSQNEEAKTEFKTNAQCRVFLSSDAGSHGLNLPEARYVLNYDTPFSYDTLMQRCDRIDRADSWLDGLEARIYYYEDTIEERIWEVNNYRRYLASVVQGTEERLHRPPIDLDADESNHQMMDWLMFGSKGK